MHTDEPGLNSLSERIIGCALRVLNVLGARCWKAASASDAIHYAQWLDYQKGTRKKLCFLPNFGTLAYKSADQFVI